MWVRFVEDFDYKPRPSVTIGYRAGMHLNVKRECALQAISKNKAIAVDRDGREMASGEGAIGRRSEATRRV